MTDFDKLERLVQLKATGALTEEEFQSEKAKLLATEQPRPAEASAPTARRWWLIGGGVAAIVVILIAIVAALQRPRDDGTSNTIDQNALAAEGVAPEPDETSPAAAPAQPAEGSYAWATSFFRIGENPSYIEKVLGPAKQKDKSSLFYDLQGCIVNYLTKGTQVTGVQMIVSEKCTPEVGDRVITPQTTFGSVYSGLGFLQTSCLSMCGNKADPTIEYVIPGAHASNWVGVSYSTYDGSDGANIWAEEIAKAKGVASSFDVPYGGFLCPPKPSQAVVDAMKNAKVESVTIGIGVEKCAEW